MLELPATYRTSKLILAANNKKIAMTKQPARVFSITSGKGGVGKTHVTVNLGVAISKLGHKVLLLDADMGLANINILLGFQPKATIQDVVSGKAKISDIIVTSSFGVDVIPAASGIPELTNLSEEERLALMSSFEELGDRYDYILIDTAAGIGDNVMYFNVAAEDVLVVIDSEPTTLTDAYALIKVLAQRCGVRQFNIIANRTPAGTDGRTTYAQLAAASDKFLRDVSLKYLGSICDDRQVSEAVIAQRPFIELYPGSKASINIANLAKKLTSKARSKTPSGGMQFLFQSLLKANN